MKEFLYGAATSAHQVEGHNIHNDWWKAEQTNKVPFKSGVATDHYHRFKEDLALAKALGHTAYRLSIEWSRIEPAKGQWNYREIEHYRAVLEEIHRLKMEPFVTLHHFTNPQWFTDRGGWAKSGNIEFFTRYVKVITEHLRELVRFWIPINEANVYVAKSYLKADWPPFQHSIVQGWRVMHTMIKAHQAAYTLIHRLDAGAQVGTAHNVIFFTNHPFKDWLYNHYFISQLKDQYDFLGLNYYFSAEKNWTGSVSDLQWPINPDGLKKLLSTMKLYKKPIYITENGLADKEDNQRADFIRSHLRAIEQAQQAGADVRGYFYWSLLDNFEWADGFEPKFGLIEVDYATQERRIRPSAYVYKAIIESAQK